ncbi:hypothetical protein V2E39_22755 [Chryseobacterium arthrosphaerae]|uniref:Uncharacterized protein n=1 Tax=Chryseobacterium arthrosphaerae TaxID=651561 RepID=A0ABU7R605_9FLAO
MEALKINTWYNIQEEKFLKYMSKADLFEAGQNNLLEMKKEILESGSYYSFFKDGKPVASFYQDHTFGFCTQPYGVCVKNV